MMHAIVLLKNVATVTGSRSHGGSFTVAENLIRGFHVLPTT